VSRPHRAHGLAWKSGASPGDGVVAGFGEIDLGAVAVIAPTRNVIGGSLERSPPRRSSGQELALATACPASHQRFRPAPASGRSGRPRRVRRKHLLRNVRSSGVIRRSVIAGPCTGGAVYSARDHRLQSSSVAGQGYMFIHRSGVIRVVTRRGGHF